MSLFKRIIIPNILVPKKGLEAATKIAKDFALFIDSVTEEYNHIHSTNLTSAEGLIVLMDSGVTFQQLLDENADKVGIVKAAISQKWSHQKGFSKAHIFVSPKWAKWWTYNILAKYRSDLGKAIIEHSKGEQWTEEFVVGFKSLIWGK